MSIRTIKSSLVSHLISIKLLKSKDLVTYLGVRVLAIFDKTTLTFEENFVEINYLFTI